MWRRAVNNLLRVFEHPDSGLEEELPELLRIFKDDLPEESKARITTLSDLFDELQKCRVIHIDDLTPLKQALGYVGRHDLVENVKELERQRVEQSGPIQRYGSLLQINAIRFSRGAGSVAWAAIGGAGSVARTAVGGAGSVARAAVGAVNLKTVIRVGAAAVVGVTVYNICTKPPKFFDEFSTRALPHGNTLIEMSNGCLCFTVQAKDLPALRALWDSYQEGTLKKRLQELLLTEKIKQLAKSQEVEVDVTIDEQEYKDACLDLMAARIQVQQIQEEENQTGLKRRWCSESDVSDYEAKAKDTSLLLRDIQPLVEDMEKQKMFVQVPKDEPRFKDLSDETLNEVSRRLEADEGAWETFLRVSGLGVSDEKQKLQLVFRSYPDTTIASLKPTLEALELYEVVELLEGVKPRASSSLNFDWSVDEMEKLPKTDKRVVTYHSSAAVLIFENKNNKDATGKIGKFFLELNPKNMVKVINVDGNEVSDIRKRRNDMEEALTKIERLLSRDVEYALEEVERVLKRNRKWQQQMERGKGGQKELESGKEGLKELEREKMRPEELAREMTGMKELESENEGLKELERKKMALKELERGMTGMKELEREKMGLKELKRGKMELMIEAVLLKVESLLSDVTLGLLNMEVFMQGKELGVMGARDWLDKDYISSYKLRSLVFELLMHGDDGADESAVQEEMVKLQERKEMVMKEAEKTRTKMDRVKLWLMEITSDDIEKLKTEVSRFFDEWSRYQDKCDFFALLDFAMEGREEMDVVAESVRKIQASLPGKTKLVVTSLAKTGITSELSEALVVSNVWQKMPKYVYDILSKRWKTTDLLSMMSEFRRTAAFERCAPVWIEDKLSSRVRFQKLEDKEDDKSY